MISRRVLWWEFKYPGVGGSSGILLSHLSSVLLKLSGEVPVWSRISRGRLLKMRVPLYVKKLCTSVSTVTIYLGNLIIIRFVFATP